MTKENFGFALFVGGLLSLAGVLAYVLATLIGGFTTAVVFLGIVSTIVGAFVIALS